MTTCRVCHHRHSEDRCPLCRRPAIATESADRVVQPEAQRAIVPASLRPIARGDRGSMFGGVSLEGTIIETRGPSQMDTPRNPWKCGCTLLALVAVLPALIALWLLLFAVQGALWMVGFGRSSRGRSFLSELLFYHLLEVFLRRPEPTVVYHHVLETDSGQHLVRHEGEFRDGAILVGHRVRVTGNRVRGVLVVHDGLNLTVGAHFTRPRRVWPVLFLLLGVVVSIEYAILYGLLQALRGQWGG